MINKLRNRLIATIMAFVSIIVLVAFISIYIVTYVRIHNENMEKINSAEQVRITSDNQIIYDNQVITDAFVISRISPAVGVYFLLVTDASGSLLYIDSVLYLNMEDYEMAAAIAMKNPKGGMAEFGGRKWQYAAGPGILQFDDNNNSAQYDGLMAIRFLDISDSYKTLEALIFTLIGLYISLMVVFFILALHFANRSIRPMAKAWESQRQFIADASHELKTPISTLNANLDILYASQEDTIKEQVKWLDNSKKVLSRMAALIQSMLELAKVDELSDARNMEDVIVNYLLDEIADCYAPFAAKKNIAIVEDIEFDVHVFANYSMIQQAVEILMDNAVRYANENGEIRISAYAEKNNAVIKVENTGDGISPADIDKIFDRFYRGDKARVNKEDNYGLGLSIAKSIVQKLGGEIRTESNSEWTSFTVNIPIRKHRRA